MQNNFYVTKNKDDIKINQVVELLHKSEWAANREEEQIIKSVENSSCYSILNDKKSLIGFARIITDFSTTFYLMDVFIEETYRGLGLGKLLMNEIMKDVGHLYGILHTDSAQKFYESYGFVVTATSESGESIMERRRGSRFYEQGHCVRCPAKENFCF